MKKNITYGIVILLFLIPSFGIIHPVIASDGQFIDHILLFEPPTTIHSFNLTLEKNQKYDFSIEVYSPGVKIYISLRLTGPDGDGDGFGDEFYIGCDEFSPSVH